MCENKIARYEMVELLVTTVATRQSFSDVPQLRTQQDQQIIITNIEFFPLSAYANSQSVNTIAGIPNAEIPKITLALYMAGEERIHLLPLAKLNQIQDGVTPFHQYPNVFDRLTFVDWTKSYLQYSAAPVPTYVVPLGITYLKLNRETNSPV